MTEESKKWSEEGRKGPMEQKKKEESENAYSRRCQNRVEVGGTERNMTKQKR
jgi:hypothetical protein